MSESKSDKPILLVIDGPRVNEYWTLNDDTTILGRDEECDISVPDRQISRQHIRIHREGKRYFVSDLESRNGTWVNGERLEGTRELFDNDEIQVALAIKLQFVGSGATAPLPFRVPDKLTGRLRIDPESRRVYIKDVELDPPLSLPQYRLLELLMNNPGKICTRDNVIEAVWPEAVGEGVSEQAIDALVRRLRDRLAEVDPNWQYIITIRGHGFRFENPQE
jgi:hypothetical protein